MQHIPAEVSLDGKYTQSSVHVLLSGDQPLLAQPRDIAASAAAA